jgi:hypothetical protein
MIMVKKLMTGLDFLGMSTSLICALHCSAVPLLLSFGVLNGTHLSHNHSFDLIMVITGLVIATFSLWKDLAIHKSYLPILTAVVGFVLLFFGVVMHLHHPAYNIVGGLLVCCAHVINYKINRTARASA